MKALPWLILALLVGGAALWFFLTPGRLDTPGAGKFDNYGRPDPNRIPPPDVGDDALANSIGDTVSSVFRTAVLAFGGKK